MYGDLKRGWTKIRPLKLLVVLSEAPGLVRGVLIFYGLQGKSYRSKTSYNAALRAYGKTRVEKEEKNEYMVKVHIKKNQ